MMMLWVDKHKPRSSNQLVGNNSLVGILRVWLQKWQHDAVQQKKAVLISGPPGIGKTSVAHILAKEMGFAVVEVNASDTRNKSDTKIRDGIGGKLANVIKEMITNETIFTKTKTKTKTRQVLVMDEVDGMSGGVQDLIDTIKHSKIPIICICNDKWNQKLKSLRNHCLELEFKRPMSVQTCKRMQEICAVEGIRVNDATMIALVDSANGDLRSILGRLQMVRLSRCSVLRYDKVGGNVRDFEMGGFAASRALLDPGPVQSINERLSLIFADSDLVPLMLQENYVNHRPAVTRNDDQRMRALAKAAESFSASDVLMQNGSLWPAAYVSCVTAATYMRGGRECFQGEMNFPRFPGWLGNHSTSKKQQRLLGEVTTTMGASGNMPSHRTVVRTEYLSSLRSLLSKPLRRAESDPAAIPSLLDLMDSYCITREQFDYIMDVTSFKTKAPWGADPVKDVPRKIKSAFTRTFNRATHPARCGLMLDDPKRARAAAAASTEAEAGPGEDQLYPSDKESC
jgi:replication factor C subunit 1